jgi:ABC-type phosphate transport system substrate-binding protein
MPLKNRNGWLLIGLVLGLTGRIAMADVVVVVSAKSPVGSLSKAQVEDLFLGKTIRFPDGSLAVAVDQAEGSAVRDEFYDKVLGKSAAQIKAYWSKIIFTGRGQPPHSVPNTIEMMKRVGSDPTAIGYINRDMLNDSVRAVFQVRESG